jgi:hypothetical protein
MSFCVPAQKTSHIELVDSDGNVGRIVFHDSKFYFQRLTENDAWEGGEVIVDPQNQYSRTLTFKNIVSKGDIEGGKRSAAVTP